MKKIGVLFIIFLIIFIFAVIYVETREEVNLLPTYFTYTAEEQASLSKITSNQSIAESSLRKWDGIMFDLVKENKLGDGPASRIYAYVYVAQRDAAFLSYNIKQKFMGNLDAVSGEVLCLFFPKDCSKIKFQSNEDAYSSHLAKIILNKIKLRKNSDTLKEHLATQLPGEGHWLGTKPYFGQEVGSWQPWVITSVKQFLPPKPFAPNKQSWQEQLEQSKTALRNNTPRQTLAIVFWAGNPSTVTPPGIWLKFANDYIEIEKTPLPKKLFTRSVLAMGIADVVIALFDAKYTYWIKRPFMLDPNIHTVMPTPNHPSYPAAHSGISAAAATILSYYYPKNKEYWWKKANEASASRVWGGIHFPIDAREGLILGRKVGNAVIHAQLQLNLD